VKIKINASEQTDRILSDIPAGIGIIISITVVMQAGLTVVILSLKTYVVAGVVRRIRDTGSIRALQFSPESIVARPDSLLRFIEQLPGRTDMIAMKKCNIANSIDR